MADETPRLRALLEELHGELTRLSATGVDDARRAELLELQAEIERLLAPGNVDTTSAAPEDGPTLRGRLQALVAAFEGAHPQIASALEQSMNALSNMGL